MPRSGACILTPSIPQTRLGEHAPRQQFCLGHGTSESQHGEAAVLQLLKRIAIRFEAAHCQPLKLMTFCVASRQPTLMMKLTFLSFTRPQTGPSALSAAPCQPPWGGSPRQTWARSATVPVSMHLGSYGLHKICRRGVGQKAAKQGINHVEYCTHFFAVSGGCFKLLYPIISRPRAGHSS